MIDSLQALTDPCAHRPYPPRIPRDDDHSPGKDVERGGVPDTDVYRPDDRVNGQYDGSNNRVSLTDSRTPLVNGQTKQTALPRPPGETYVHPTHHHQQQQQYQPYAQPGLADQAGSRLRTRSDESAMEQVPLDGLKPGRRSGEEGVMLQPGQTRRGDEAFL